MLNFAFYASIGWVVEYYYSYLCVIAAHLDMSEQSTVRCETPQSATGENTGENVTDVSASTRPCPI